MELTARSLKVGLQQLPVRGPNEFDGAFSAMTKSRVDAVVIIEGAARDALRKTEESNR